MERQLIMWKKYLKLNWSWLVKIKICAFLTDELMENLTGSFWIFNNTISDNKWVTLCWIVWPWVIILCCLFKPGKPSLSMYWRIDSSFKLKNNMDHWFYCLRFTNCFNYRLLYLQKMHKERDDRVNLYQSKWTCCQICNLGSKS